MKSFAFTKEKMITFSYSSIECVDKVSSRNVSKSELIQI